MSIAVSSFFSISNRVQSFNLCVICLPARGNSSARAMKSFSGALRQPARSLGSPPGMRARELLVMRASSRGLFVPAVLVGLAFGG
jgi:hypothetical protein